MLEDGFDAYKRKSNYQYANLEAKEMIDKIMESQSAHYFLKDLIARGLEKDPVDCLHNLQVAVKVFELLYQR